jgi:4-amino-4-deoxy-L-arabinose transferase-like glycosyltransferase
MASDNKNRYQNLILSSIIFILSASILLPNLNRHFLWQDEAQTALISRSILTDFVPKISNQKNSFSQELGAEADSDGVYKWHPWVPFYIHALFFGLFGESDFIARFPDALFGMGTAFVCWWILISTGRGKRAAFIAATVLLLMVPFLVLSRQCRYYSMASFFSAGCIWAYVQLMQSKKRAGIFLTLSTLLLFYTQLVFGAIFTSAVLIHSAIAGKEIFKRLWIPIACIICGVVPWLVYSSEVIYRSGYSQAFKNIYNAMIHLNFYSRQLERYIVPLSFLLLVLIMSIWWRKKILVFWKEKQLFTNFYFLYIFLTLIVLSLVASGSFFRYLSPILPVCALLCAEIIESGFRVHPVCGTVCMIAFILNQPLLNYYHELTQDFKGPMEGLVGYLHQNAQPTDTVAITFGDMPIKWYTGLRVIGGLTGENLEGTKRARWVILRKHINCEKDEAVAEYLLIHLPWKQYRRIVLPAPDTPYENREDPEKHLFQTAIGEDSVAIYERTQ